MKFCRALICWIFLLLFVSPTWAQSTAPQANNGLRIKIECEEPSGVLWDRDTLQTARSVLFSIHVFNQTPESRIVTLSWKIRDAAGKTVLDNKEKYTVPGGQHATRRELFSARNRGGFVLSTFAESRADGPDFKALESFPFAILSAPPGTNVLRTPVVLPDAPLGLTEPELTFLERIGARAVRSTIAGTDTAASRVQTPQELDAALQTRAAHGIATVGVLAAPPRTSLRDDEEWLQASLLLITRYPDIRTWEVVGDPAPDTLSEIARAARNMNPPRSVLAVAPSTSGAAQSRAFASDGVLFVPPSNEGDIHAAALRRAFFANRNRARDLNAPAFHIRDDASTQTGNAYHSSSDFVTRTVLALAAGAAGTSAALGSWHNNDSSDHAKFARGAAFAAMNDLLGDAQFHAEAFPESPVVMAEVFARESGGSVAVIWVANNQHGQTPDGKLTAWLPDAEVLDLFGNRVENVQRKSLEIPLGPHPIYLTSRARPEEVLRSLREGTVSGIAPLAAQVLPITQIVDKAPEKNPDGKKSDGKLTPVVRTDIRVRLQNIGVRDMSGQLEVNPPPSWKLAAPIQNFHLAPGASQIYVFNVVTTKQNDKYPVVVKAVADAQSGRGSWGWNQDAPIAVATNVTPSETMTVDGRLDDWRNSQWMQLATSKRNRVDGQLAMRWDARNLFFAARVKENRLQPRRADAPEYSFWQGYDAIQLGFGIREAAWTIPANIPFRDAELGFLLSPFHVRPDGTVEARVLRLWGGPLPFDALPDRVRWGGAVPGARCEVRRDERSGETVYEAMIPLSELPEIAPETRVATMGNSDNPIRFSWILHTDEAGSMQWASQANVFPWWNNTLSFLPSNEANLAVQTLLGFAQRGEISGGGATTSTVPGSTPLLVVPPAAVPPATVPPASVPPATVPPTTVTPNPNPPTVIAPAPIPPNRTPLPLPPAPQPSHNPPLPPSAVAAPPETQPELLPYFPPQNEQRAESTSKPPVIRTAVKAQVATSTPARKAATQRTISTKPAVTVKAQPTPKTAIAASKKSSASNTLSRILPMPVPDDLPPPPKE